MSEPREEVISRLLIGDSRAIQRVRRDILQFGPTRLPILVQGPTGSGKELVARAIHAVSGRKGDLVAFNVCALQEGMFEDALFGHVRGAFTGASQDAIGYLAEANGGTIFLDEISGLGLHSQAKLLRALETGIFRPVGAGRDRMSDFRLVSASNEELFERVREMRFREDLLHRIGGCTIQVPSLAERPDDIPILAQHFLDLLVHEHVEIAAAALARLQEYRWSGNVRALRHAIERALVLAQGGEISLSHVESAVGPQRADEHSANEAFNAQLLSLLDQHQWNTAAVADALHVHRATVYRWMKRLPLNRSRIQRVHLTAYPASAPRSGCPSSESC